MEQPLWHIVFCFVPLLTVEIILSVRYKKKDFVLLMQGAVLLGLVSLIPASIMQTILLNSPLSVRFFQSSLPLLLIYSLVVNGFIEEASKACSFLLIPLKKINYIDFLFLGLIVGLSFGCFETVIYMINGTKNLLLRFFTAGILHGACCVCSAVTVYNIKTEKNFKKNFWFVRSCFLHGFYNFFYVIGSGFIVCAVFCVVASVYFAHKAFLEN